MTTATDHQLLVLARTDPAAFGTFYERHEAALLAFLVRAAGNPESAADLMAETFAALLVAVGRDIEIEQPRAWLYAVARRKLIDAARRGAVDARARHELGMQAVALSGDSAARIAELADDRSEAAQAALAALPGDERVAVQARVIDELTYDEIARALATSEPVVRKRVSRGLARLRRRVGEETA